MVSALHHPRGGGLERTVKNSDLLTHDYSAGDVDSLPGIQHKKQTLEPLDNPPTPEHEIPNSAELGVGWEGNTSPDSFPGQLPALSTLLSILPETGSNIHFRPTGAPLERPP